MLEQAKGEKKSVLRKSEKTGRAQRFMWYILPTKNLDLIPSSTLMSSIEYELFTKWQREFYPCGKCIQKIKDTGNYDYILIDAPPTLGGWVMNYPLCIRPSNYSR